MIQELSFSTHLRLTEDESGLFVPAIMAIGGKEVAIEGYFDPGAAYCVIPRRVGEKLKPDIESGQAVTLRTGGGPMPTYRHYAVLTLGDLIFDDVPVCVAKYHDFNRCLIGRAGWLQKVRLGLVVYDDALYLNLHGQ